MSDPNEWRDHAACRGEPTDLFFIGRGESGAPAKAICARCPVRLECLIDVLERPLKFGIFAGLTEFERRPVRRIWRRAVAQGEDPHAAVAEAVAS